MLRVLNCSAHEELQALRHSVLSKAPDCEVLSPPKEHFLRALDHGKFDVLVICYLIENEGADALCTKFRRTNPAGRVVGIVSVAWSRSCEADVIVDAHKPAALLTAVSSYPAAQAKFKRERRLTFHDSETWSGWSCDRCCWNRRGSSPTPGAEDAASRVQAEFDRHSCEVFARDTWEIEES